MSEIRAQEGWPVRVPEVVEHSEYLVRNRHQDSVDHLHLGWKTGFVDFRILAGRSKTRRCGEEIGDHLRSVFHRFILASVLRIFDEKVRRAGA